MISSLQGIEAHKKGKHYTTIMLSNSSTQASIEDGTRQV